MSLNQFISWFDCAKSLIACENIYTELRYLNGLYWRQKMPDGRFSVVYQAPWNEGADVLTPAPFSVGTSVYGYGGGSYAPAPDGYYFVDKTSAAILFHDHIEFPYVVVAGSDRAVGGLIYIESLGGVVFVSHAGSASNNFSQIHFYCTKSFKTAALYETDAFIGGVTIDETGKRIAWYEWPHSQMPWDGTSLHVGLCSRNAIHSIESIDDHISASRIEPKFVSGSLYFIDDRSGWWNIYRYSDVDKNGVVMGSNITAEFGFPPYIYGVDTYCGNEAGIFAVATRHDTRCIYRLSDRVAPMELDIDADDISCPVVVNNSLYFIEGSMCHLPIIKKICLATKTTSVLNKIDGLSLHPFEVSKYMLDHPAGHSLYIQVFTAKHGANKSSSPLIVNVHGGPNGSASRSLSSSAAFWTACGFSYIEVDYVGSIGYGKEFRELLQNRWGEAECDDIEHAIGFAINHLQMTPDKLFVRGASAGGYTALQMLKNTDLFDGGCSYYGVSDLKSLLETTHIFESSLLLGLVDSDRNSDIYTRRSPLYGCESILAPLLLIHGVHDSVVPIDQSRAIKKSIESKDGQCSLLELNEGHGFDLPENRAFSLAIERAFYADIIAKGIQHA